MMKEQLVKFVKKIENDVIHWIERISIQSSQVSVSTTEIFNSKISANSSSIKLFLFIVNLSTALLIRNDLELSAVNDMEDETMNARAEI